MKIGEIKEARRRTQKSIRALARWFGCSGGTIRRALDYREPRRGPDEYRKRKRARRAAPDPVKARRRDVIRQRFGFMRRMKTAGAKFCDSIIFSDEHIQNSLDYSTRKQWVKKHKNPIPRRRILKKKS